MYSRSDSSATSPSRTVVLGFDALVLDYLDDFDLPHFEALRERGSEAPLRSTHPPWTASAWPSMFTGTDPSHHGVYDFFHYGTGYPDEAVMVTRENVAAPALWNYCSARDLPSIALNMPITYPSDRIDGVSIPGYLAPEDAPGHPEGIREELDEALGTDYRIYSRAETSSDKEAKLEGYLELIDVRRRAAEHLLSTRDWRLAVIQVQKTDAVFHNFTERDAHRRIYEAADDLLGTVLETVPEDTNVIVCSDHGIGPMRGYRVYVNEVLRNHGLVEATTEGGEAKLADEKSRLVGAGENADGPDEDSSGSASLPVRAVSVATTLLDRLGVTPADVYSTAQRFGFAGVLQAVLPAEAKRGVAKHVDWAASKAYCRGRNELGVRINLEGREPNGVVPQSEYEAVRSQVISVLEDLETPDGRPAFEWVVRREELYDGPYAEAACDVLFMPDRMDHAVETKLVGRQFVRAEGYDHKPYGTFIASGPAFCLTDLESLSLLDVAPIVMASLGKPIPERMTGDVPPDFLKTPVSTDSYADVSVDTGTDDVTDDRIEERLSDLGYL